MIPEEYVRTDIECILESKKPVEVVELKTGYDLQTIVKSILILFPELSGAYYCSPSKLPIVVNADAVACIVRIFRQVPSKMLAEALLCAIAESLAAFISEKEHADRHSVNHISRLSDGLSLAHNIHIDFGNIDEEYLTRNYFLKFDSELYAASRNFNTEFHERFKEAVIKHRSMLNQSVLNLAESINSILEPHKGLFLNWFNKTHKEAHGVALYKEKEVYKAVDPKGGSIEIKTERMVTETYLVYQTLSRYMATDRLCVLSKFSDCTKISPTNVKGLDKLFKTFDVLEVGNVSGFCNLSLESSSYPIDRKSTRLNSSHT